MHWHCPRHYVHMLWLLWIAFQVYFCQGLCAWQWTYSARMSQLLAAHKLCRSATISGYHIQDYVASKTTAQPTIHNTSHYSRIPSWHCNNAARHKQTASGKFLLVQQRSSLWLRMKWETAISWGFQLESFTRPVWFLLPVFNCTENSVQWIIAKAYPTDKDLSLHPTASGIPAAIASIRWFSGGNCLYSAVCNKIKSNHFLCTTAQHQLEICLCSEDRLWKISIFALPLWLWLPHQVQILYVLFLMHCCYLQAKLYINIKESIQ